MQGPKLNLVRVDPFFGFPLNDNEYALGVYKALHQKNYECLTQYVGSKEFMMVVCPNGHTWSGYSSKVTIPCNNCQECWKSRGCTSEEKLAEVIAARGGIQLTPYVLSKYPVMIRCPEGHDFACASNYILSGTWCQICGGNNVEEAKRNFYSILASNGARALTPYVNSITKVDIMCQYGHTYDQVPTSANMGFGCRYCAGMTVEQGETHFREAVQARGGIVLGEYVNRNTSVQVQCGKDHFFEAVPQAVTAGNWCAKCSNRCPEQAKEQFIATVLSQGGTVLGEYINCRDKVMIKCQFEHIFEMDPLHLTRGHWCHACRNVCPIQAQERFRTVVAERNGTVVGTYVNTYTKVELQCEKGHIFSARPNNITHGKWCRKCGLAESNGERVVRLCLEQRNISHRVEATFDWMPKKRYDFNFIHNERNYIIEFDGIQHFQLVEYFHKDEETFHRRQEVDVDKTFNAISKGHYMIRIAYSDIGKVPAIIDACINNPQPEALLYCSDKEQYSWLCEAVIARTK